jgi:dephospho-CoA kinase
MGISPVIRNRLISLFGEQIYVNGILNKALLASYIFHDKEKLEKVNAIVHPEVAKDFSEWLDRHRQDEIIAHETAILFESGFGRLVDKVVMVYTPLEMRIERTMKRDNTSREKVLERIRNQMPEEEKVKLSDYVIVNDNTRSLIEQVLQILEQLKNSINADTGIISKHI